MTATHPAEPSEPSEPSEPAELTLRIGSPVHGGHCLARTDEGRVVFVRHGAPGELVRARPTSTGKVWRADAVEILEPSPDRVASPWAAAGPGGVGAVELAHLNRAAQLRWKEEVLRDALRRIARLDLDVVVNDPEPGADGWATRTRITLTCDGEGRPGMHAHRSDRIVPLADMPLAVRALRELDVFSRVWPAGTVLTLIAPSEGAPVVLADGVPVAHPGSEPREWVHETVTEAVSETGATHSFDYEVAAGGFWQSHRSAPRTLVAAVLTAAGLAGGEGRGGHLLDLYSGAGLFSLPLARAVGVGGGGRVLAIEGDRRAAAAARRNARGLANLHGRRGDVARLLAGGADRDRSSDPVDTVVLDPPRTGAGPRVLEQIVGRRPERIVYVACDPAALARDLGHAATAGYRAERIEAHDLFPHTHHVEAIAVLRPV